MEFWGVEVKPGEPLKIKPEVFKLIHISQAAMGEVKNGKGPNRVPIRLKVDDKLYVIGILSAEDRPQLMFDLVLHKEFELSHDWKDGSIYFTGYIGDDDSLDEDFSDEDENEDNEVDIPENGKLEPVKPDTRKTVPVKPKPAEKSTSKPAEKSTSKPVKVKKDKSQSDEDDDDKRIDALEHLIDSDDSDDDDEDDDDSNDDDDDDDGQNLVSHKAKPVKKRPSETATESHVQAAKKTKLAAPEKSGVKTPATNGKLKENNPKSAGQTSCKSCSKTFNSDKALESHKKAKHDGK